MADSLAFSRGQPVVFRRKLCRAGILRLDLGRLKGKTAFDLVQLCADFIGIQRHFAQPLEQLSVLRGKRLVLRAQLVHRGLSLGQLRAQLGGLGVVFRVGFFYVMHYVLAVKAAEDGTAESTGLLVHCSSSHNNLIYSITNSCRNGNKIEN